MKNILRKHLYFQETLFLYLSIFIILLSVVSTLILSYFYFNSYIEKNNKYVNELNNTTAKSLNALFSDMDSLALYLSTNLDIKESFKKVEDMENFSERKRFLYGEIKNIVTSISVPNNTSNFRVNIFDKNRNFITTGFPVDNDVLAKWLESEDYEKWYESLEIEENSYSFVNLESDYLSKENEKFFSLYREVYSINFIDKPVAIVEIQCPSKYIGRLINFDNNDYIFEVRDESGNIISTNKAGKKVSKNIYSKIYLSNLWSLSIYQNEDLEKNTFYMLIIISIIGMILLMLIVNAIIYLITNRLTFPLRKLSDELLAVTIDNMHISDIETYNIRELEVLNTTFYTMFERLNTSIDENIKLKDCETRAQLIALQSQIDPHFIYNTLATIKASNRSNNRTQINDICDCLAKMLRYSHTYTDEEVSLKDELDAAKLYLNIMKIRYEDLFEYNINIADNFDLENKKLVRFFLQPLLENSFKHGFSKVAPPYYLDINIEEDESFYYIEVLDNGIGISDEAIKDLEYKLDTFISNTWSKLPALSFGGMGFVNSLARLKIYFKENFFYEIKVNNGTSIRLGVRKC